MNYPRILQKVPEFDKLNFRQKTFLLNYYNRPKTGWSNVQCYCDAYGPKNEKAARVSASQLLTKPNIAACK